MQARFWLTIAYRFGDEAVRLLDLEDAGQRDPQMECTPAKRLYAAAREDLGEVAGDVDPPPTSRARYASSTVAASAWLPGIKWT